MKKHKSPPASKQDVLGAGELSAPHTYLNAKSPPDESRLVTTLLRAGEAFAEPWRDPDFPRSEASNATPEENASLPYFEDFDWLRDFAVQLRARIAEDPRRQEFLAQLIAAFGDGELLKLLFQRLFPGQAPRRTLLEDGSPVLSEREAEALFWAAHDHSYEEIAARLHIAKKTVGRHFENIYEKLGVNRPMQGLPSPVCPSPTNAPVWPPPGRPGRFL